MVSHVSLGAEALAAALGAMEGALVDMDALVDAKILFLTEGFSTARVQTLEGLGPVMKLEVSVHPGLP